MTSIDLSNINFPDVMGIRDSALYAGLSEQYVRTMVRNGTLAATKTEAGEWQITKAALDELKAKPRSRGGGAERANGKAYVINVKVSDLPAVEAALGQFGISLKPRYVYKAKVKGATPAATETTESTEAEAEAPSGRRRNRS
jgi:hypothetical protein